MTDYTDKINALQNDVISVLEADRDNTIDLIIGAAQSEDVGSIRALFGPLSSSVAMIDGINEVIQDLTNESTQDNAPSDAAPSSTDAAPAADSSAPIQDNSTVSDSTQPATTDPNAITPASDPSAVATPASDPAASADPNAPAQDASTPADANVSPAADPATPTVQDPNQPAQ